MVFTGNFQVLGKVLKLNRQNCVLLFCSVLLKGTLEVIKTQAGVILILLIQWFKKFYNTETQLLSLIVQSKVKLNANNLHQTHTELCPQKLDTLKGQTPLNHSVWSSSTTRLCTPLQTVNSQNRGELQSPKKKICFGVLPQAL